MIRAYGSSLRLETSEGSVRRFQLKLSRVFLWSDSLIVLAWLRSETSQLKLFVGVRVVGIQSTWEASPWRYVQPN